MVCYSLSRERHQGIPDSSSFEIIFPSRCCCCPFLTSTKLTLSPLERILSGRKCQWMRQECRVSPMGHGLCHTCPGVCCPFGVWTSLLDSADLWVESPQELLGCRDRGPSREQHLGDGCWWEGLAAGPRTAWPCCWLQLGIPRGAACSKCAQPAPVHFLPSISTCTGVIVKAKCISVSYSQDFRSWLLYQWKTYREVQKDTQSSVHPSGFS